MGIVQMVICVPLPFVRLDEPRVAERAEYSGDGFWLPDPMLSPYMGKLFGPRCKDWRVDFRRAPTGAKVARTYLFSIFFADHASDMTLVVSSGLSY